MLKLSGALLYVFIVVSVYGSLAVPSKSASPGSQSKDLETRCTEHCFSMMRTVMDYVVANQEKWNTCKQTTENNTLSEQNRILIQLATLQDEVTSVKTSQESQDIKLDGMMESFKKIIPQDFEEKLDRTEAQFTAIKNDMISMQIKIDNHILVAKETQTSQASLKEAVGNLKASLESSYSKLERQQVSMQESLRKIIAQDFEHKLSRTEANLERKLEAMQSRMDSQLTAIKETLSSLNRNRIPPGFERIGERYFYIEEDVKLNWTDAEDACRRMGGHLASIQSREKFDAITAKLDSSEKYFLGINDRAVMGKFVSEASGRRASFFKWYPGEPKSTNDREHCLAIKQCFMFVNNCTYTKKFICQADDKV
ncbi:hypothetical protein KR084_006179 [Drosophila pseudotakahashii]|nr:hypothetical protein KR084_006179 [Drosophila pseudotakahashii]